MASNDAYMDKLNLEVKKEITSLLISSPKGLSVKQLRNDYCDFIGRQIPFKDMGYYTLESYLMSIPDVLRVVGNGIHAMVVPVVTEKNKHINEMIMKQKAPKSNSRYKPMKRSAGIYNIKPQIPRKIPPLMSVKCVPEAEPFKLPVMPTTHINPPHDYVLDCRRQQNSTPKRKPPNNISYCKPQQNISYSKPQQNNDSYPCDNRLNRNNNQQINPEPNTSTAVQAQPEPVKRYPSHRNDFDDSEDSDADFFREVNFSDEDEGFEYFSDNESDLTTSMKNMVVDNKIRNLIEAQIIEDSEMEEPHIPRVNKTIIEKLKILIGEHPDGIWCSKLLKLYEQRFGQKLDPLNFGFASVVQMCDDLPDVFQCVRPNRTDWKLYDKNNPSPDTCTVQDFSKYLDSLPISEEIKINTEPALPSNLMYDSPGFNYPDEVMKPGELSKRQWLENFEKSGDYIELLVTEVYDPSKFWIHLRGSTTSDALGKLMDEMQIYYMNNAKNVPLNDSNVQVGLMCAALFMNEYHRAIVIKIFDDSTIKVFYCDYGTVAQVHLRKTCFLLKTFAELPMQAVRARLANIIPQEQNTMWPRAASTYMLQLVSEKDLIGYIHAIDYEQEILDLIITDTTVPDIDVHINDELVEKGYAVLGTEAPLCTTSSAIIPNVHLYPAFEELENAIYPCISDVITMLKIGHTYETIYNGYFSTSANSDYTQHYSALHHSRCSTGMDQSYSFNADTSQEDANNEYSLNQDFLEQVNFAEQEYEYSSQSNSNAESNTSISPVSSVSKNDVADTSNEIDVEDTNNEIYEEDRNNEIVESQNDETSNTEDHTENTKENISKKPPPGFENVIPRSFEGTDFINLFRNQAMGAPLYSSNTVPGVPLVKNPLQSYQNYPYSNTINSSYNYLLSNPVIYNQLMINQQREAYLRTIQQVKLVQDLHKLQALQQHQQFIQMAQAVNSFPQNYNTPTATQNANYNYSQPDNTYQQNPVMNSSFKTNDDVPSCSSKMKPLGDNKDLEFNNISPITTDVNNDSIPNISEHICDRFIHKLKIKDCVIHILNIEGKYYVVSQEIITNLLKNDLPWRLWLKYMNLSATSFPNEVVNIMDYERLYNQIIKYTIPGVNSSNLGCNVRLTSLNHVPDIVEKYGNRKLASDLKTEISKVMKNSDIWKVLDPLAD